INTLKKSEKASATEVIALRSYYNFLSYFLDNPIKNIHIYSRNREIARNNNKVPLLIKYLLPATRELLYDNAPNLMQEII
ncbi:site-specific integrase, partial [Vibrio astriarenae]